MRQDSADTNTTESTDESRDRELLRRIAARDRTALKTLYESYYQRLIRFIAGITGSVDSAQEGINDVMLVIWEKADTFAGRSRVSTWIMGIAYRKALKLNEKAVRWQTRFKASDVAPWNEPSDELREPSRMIEGTDALEHSLRQLPTKQRAVVELTFRHGYSYEEIAKIVDCPVNTVKTRMFHARQRLKALAPELFES